jgi:hypothetical protein
MYRMSVEPRYTEDKREWLLLKSIKFTWKFKGWKICDIKQ